MLYFYEGFRFYKGTELYALAAVQVAISHESGSGGRTVGVDGPRVAMCRGQGGPWVAISGAKEGIMLWFAIFSDVQKRRKRPRTA